MITYTSGSVEAEVVLVGLVGSNTGIIRESYAESISIGKQYVGGLVGGNGGTIVWSYVTKILSGKRR